MDIQNALSILFSGRQPDLTAEGYLEAISTLRQGDPSLARRVERVLEPKLKELFPRRAIAWHETSVGVNFRTILLPDNTHFQQDVTEIRKVLGIGKGQVHTTEDHSIRIRPCSDSWVPDEKVIEFADRELASLWYRQHRRSVEGLPPDSFASQLTIEELESARTSASVDASSLNGPSWMKEIIESPDCRSTQSGVMSPIHKLVSALLWRHRLPHHMCGLVEIYLLTLNRENLANIEPYEIEIYGGKRGFRNSSNDSVFSITVTGLDEFTTNGDWERFWERYIKPYLDMFMERRGQRPSGRQAPDIERLKKSMPLYKEYLQTGSVGEALNELAKSGDQLGELDDETARRMILDIDNLLNPGDA